MARIGFGIECPYCLGSADSAEITICPNELGRFFCSNCGDEYDIAKAIQVVTTQAERWTNLAAWLATAPQHGATHAQP